MTLVKLNNLNTRSIDPWINGIFDSIFNDSSTLSSFNAQAAKARPLVNISENEQGFEIEMAVPGFKKEDIKINLEKLLLTISLDKKEEEEEGKRYNKREFHLEAFSRSFTLPENIDGEKVSAEYTDGILKVFISKKEEEKEKVRVINVK
jgi:HSP20 family protein